MEILVQKIPEKYNGVIAYGKAVNGKTYVLTAQSLNNEIKWFIICQAKETEINEIFREDDEIGEDLLFDTYDEAIEGFNEFLEFKCMIKLTK